MAVRRYRKRFRRRFAWLKKLMVLVVALFCGVFIYFEVQIDPFMFEFTVLKGKQMMSDFFCETAQRDMEELGFDYSDLVDMTYSDKGEIQTVNTNVVNVNKLKNTITADLCKQLDEYYEYAVDIPLGNATESEFLSGLGPVITFNSNVTGSVTSEFRSEFESGGVNQTVHRLYIDVTGELVVIVGGTQEPIRLTSSILVGETVIVGGTPTLIN